MGLLSHGLAVGIGYLLGQPEGRARLAQAGRQAADLAQRPEVARIRERGKELAVNQAQTVKQKITARSTGTGTAAPGDTGTPTSDPLPGLRTSAWRTRFRRSGAAHFPSSEEVAPETTGVGTTGTGTTGVGTTGVGTTGVGTTGVGTTGTGTTGTGTTGTGTTAADDSAVSDVATTPVNRSS